MVGLEYRAFQPIERHQFPDNQTRRVKIKARIRTLCRKGELQQQLHAGGVDACDAGEIQLQGFATAYSIEQCGSHAADMMDGELLHEWRRGRRHADSLCGERCNFLTDFCISAAAAGTCAPLVIFTPKDEVF